MPIPLLSRLIKPKPLADIKFPNLSNALGDARFGNTEQFSFLADNTLKNLQKSSPESIERLGYINNALKGFADDSKAIENLKPVLNRVKSLKPDDIAGVYHHFDSIDKAKTLSRVFLGKGKKPTFDVKNVGNVYNALKSKLRGVDQSFKNMGLRHENRLFRKLRNRSPQSLSDFNLLLKNPKRFTEIHGVSQDEFGALVLQKETPKIADDTLRGIVEDFKAWNLEVLDDIKAAGIDIRSTDDYANILGMPDDAFFDLGESAYKQAFLDHVSNLDVKGVDNIIKTIKTASEGTRSSFKFPVRKLKFNSPLAEIKFFKTMNGITEQSGYSLVSQMLMHKKGIMRKAAMTAEFGYNPKRTFKTLLNNLKASQKKLSKADVDKYSSIETSFNRMIDAYNGRKQVDSVFAEKLGESLSAVTTFFTSASGSSFLRNLFDFSLNKASVAQAIYNPKYTLGATAFEQLENVGYLVSNALGGRAARKGVDKVLDIMGFGSSLDTLSHFNLLSYENMYDVTTPLSKLDGGMSYMNNALHTINNTLLDWSGQNSFTDFRRARHLVSAQQHWANMLDHVKSFDDFVSTLSPLEAKQVVYMEQAFGIGAKEFNALKQVKRTKIKGKIFGNNIPEMITAEGILNSENIGSLNFRRKLALSWQNLMYNSTLNATPVPTLPDAITARTNLNNASSWMRFIIRPFLKFADVTQAQYEGVIDRVALATYGDRSRGLGFDKSLVNYTKAATIYLGGFIGLTWLKDMLYNKKPTDFTQKDNLVGTFIMSGFGGYPMTVLNQMMSLWGTNSGGLYGQAPLGGVIRGGKSILGGLTSDDPIKFYKGMKQAGRFSGLGTVWYTRGLTDYALQQALLSKPERRKVRNQYSRKK